MSFSDFLENEILDHVFGASAYTPPATLYIALSSTTPTDAGANFTEPPSGGYARVSVANNLTNWPAASGGAKANGVNIIFPEATGSWPTVTHFGVFDAPTGGNYLDGGALGASKTVYAGNQLQFSIGALTFTLS